MRRLTPMRRLHHVNFSPLASYPLPPFSASFTSSTTFSPSTTYSRLPQPSSVVPSLSYVSHFSSAKASKIPVISMAPYWEGSTKGKQEVARTVDRACVDIGFLTVVDHGVSPLLIQKSMNTVRQYFDLAEEEKRKIPQTDDYPYGYMGVEDENLSSGYDKGRTLPDLKEFFGLGPYDPAAGMPPQQWPLNPPEFRRDLSNYFEEMIKLSTHLLRIFALALGQPENWFDDKIDRHRSSLRAINYPAQRHTPPEGQLRASEHTDYGTLTILAQDGTGGLEAKDRNNVWHPIHNVDNSFIINLGDLMAMWTNDRWS
eukprot:g59038.t1